MANYIRPAGGIPSAAKALLIPANIRAGVRIKGGGIDVTGSATVVVYLGQGRSFNVSAYPGYKQFNANDFIAEMLPLSGEASGGHELGWYTNQSAVTCRGSSSVAKAYNASTGVFTCNGSLSYSGNDESWSSASGSAASDCKVWLILRPAS